MAEILLQGTTELWSREPTSGSSMASRHGPFSRKRSPIASNTHSGLSSSGGSRCMHSVEERLSGRDPYRSSAVLTIVHGRVEPLLDVNMTRLLKGILGPIELAGMYPKRSHVATALRLVSGRHSLRVTCAVLDFGALVCSARLPLCSECLLQTRCHQTSHTSAVSAHTHFKCSFRLTNRWWPIMMWSTSSMSRMRPASTSCKVVWISSGDGAGSPLGWL